MSDMAGMFIGLALTLVVFSYLWRDNVAYRLAVHILVGVAAAYAAIVTFTSFLWPLYLGLRENGGVNVIWLIPALLGALMLLKLAPQLAGFGNGAAAVMVGVGAAVALFGALTGSLIPLVIRLRPGPMGLLVALLTITVLAQFRMTRQSSLTDPGLQQLARVENAVRVIGQGVLSVTLGALFGSILNTSLSLLIDRVAVFSAEVGSRLSGLLP